MGCCVYMSMEYIERVNIDRANFPNCDFSCEFMMIILQRDANQHQYPLTRDSLLNSCRQQCHYLVVGASEYGKNGINSHGHFRAKGVIFSTTLLYQKLGVRPRDRLYYMKLIVTHVMEMLNIQICIVNRRQSGRENR